MPTSPRHPLEALSFWEQSFHDLFLFTVIQYVWELFLQVGYLYPSLHSSPAASSINLSTLSRSVSISPFSTPFSPSPNKSHTVSNSLLSLFHTFSSLSKNLVKNLHHLQILVLRSSVCSVYQKAYPSHSYSVCTYRQLFLFPRSFMTTKTIYR